MKAVAHNLYPFEPHFLQLRAALRMHYVDEGQGPVVLMVHGNPSWSFYYRNLIKALSGTHRCIAPDHIGMGKSDKPSDANYAYTLAQRVDDLQTLVDSLQLTGPLTLVVHDWGGMIGMAWAVRHPERVKNLVILNTAAFGLPAGKRLPWQLKLTRTPLGVVLVRGFNAFARGAAQIGCSRTPMPADVLQGYLAPYDSWANRIATLRFVQDIPLQEGAAGFELVQETAAQLHLFSQTPMLIVWGERDVVFDHHFRREWQRRFPAAQVESLADAGHYVLEDAAEQVTARIAAFVRNG